MIATEGPPDLVQHSAYRGDSHRRRGAASHISDMVWPYRPPIPMWRGGGYFTYSNEDYLLSRRLEEGLGEGGVGGG
jgi:hypothetical protein